MTYKPYYHPWDRIIYNGGQPHNKMLLGGHFDGLVDRKVVNAEVEDMKFKGRFMDGRLSCFISKRNEDCYEWQVENEKGLVKTFDVGENA